MFKESQNVNEERLKEIYNVDKVSEEHYKEDNQVIDVKRKQEVEIFTIIVVIIFVVIIFLIIRKYFHNKKY